MSEFSPILVLQT